MENHHHHQWMLWNVLFDRVSWCCQSFHFIICFFPFPEKISIHLAMNSSLVWKFKCRKFSQLKNLFTPLFIDVIKHTHTHTRLLTTTETVHTWTWWWWLNDLRHPVKSRPTVFFSSWFYSRFVVALSCACVCWSIYSRRSWFYFWFCWRKNLNITHTYTHTHT